MLATETTTRLRRVAAIGGGLIGIAALAGCAPSADSTADAAAPSTAASSATASTSASTSAGTSSTAASGALKDGTYSATGQYQSPSGESEVAVTVTLKAGTITAVKVTPKAADATSRQYESQFASGISAVAVGKKIADLQVGAVSGSSLTSQGFEKALAEIRTEAA